MDTTLIEHELIPPLTGYFLFVSSSFSETAQFLDKEVTFQCIEGWQRKREDVMKIMERVKVRWVEGYQNDNVKVLRKNKIHYQSAHRAEGGKARKKYRIIEN